MKTDQEILDGVKSLADSIFAMGGCKNLETARAIIDLMAQLERRLSEPNIVHQ